jgi:hypothetical protein
MAIILGTSAHSNLSLHKFVRDIKRRERAISYLYIILTDLSHHQRIVNVNIGDAKGEGLLKYRIQANAFIIKGFLRKQQDHSFIHPMGHSSSYHQFSGHDELIRTVRPSIKDLQLYLFTEIPHLFFFPPHVLCQKS